MSMPTLTSKGQTTIPKDIWKRLNVHPGDRLEFVIDEDGRVLVLPASIDASKLAGMLKLVMAFIGGYPGAPPKFEIFGNG
jgi:AbrB family looped-hinge helix DNA binding protein